MDTNRLLSEVKTKLSAATKHFEQELTKLRTGRAHPSILDGVMVEAYGQPMTLKSLASITAPEAQLLVIKPFDPTNIQPIAQAIRDDKELGLTPTDDGHVVRIAMPPMTTENREAMVKVLHQRVEECMIAARQARHDAIRAAEQAEKAKDIGNDQRFKLEKDVDALLAKQKDDVDKLAKAKEQEIMTV